MREGSGCFAHGLVKKIPEQLQAQAEVYGDVGLEEFSSDKDFLLKHSAELAKIEDLDNLPDDLDPKLKLFIEQNKSRYKNSLKKHHQQERDLVENNIRLYNEKFKSVISHLKEKMANGNERELPEYLGSGSNGSAFRIMVDGKQYAAKFSGSATQSNFEIKALVRAKGITHAAQLESYSFEDGVVIMELLSGRDVSNFLPDEDPQYTDEHIIELIETVKNLNGVGIIIDPKPSNFMYDKDKGFSILDFHLSRANQKNSLPWSLLGLSQLFAARKFPSLDYSASDYFEKAKKQKLEQYKIFLPLLVRFVKILKEKFPELVAAWNQFNKENEEDSGGGGRVEMVRRDESLLGDPDLAPYFKELENMGF